MRFIVTMALSRSHRFRDGTMRYCLKIANFWFWRPRWGWPHRNLTVWSPVGKLEWWDYQAMKTLDCKFSRFDTMHQCERQTDRRTDIARQQRPRYVYLGLGWAKLSMSPVTVKFLANNNAKFEQTKKFLLASLAVLFCTPLSKSCCHPWLRWL